MGARVGYLRFGSKRYLVISQPLSPPCAALSLAEQDVVGRYCEGQSLREVAEARGCSPRTVSNQVQSVYRKLGVGSRAELVRALSVASRRV